MVGGEDGRCEFSRSEEMPKIRARVAAADAAFTRWIDRILVFRVARVLNKDAAFAGIEASVTRGAGWKDAIHHVNAERNVFGNLFRLANAHEVTRTIVWKKRGDFGGHFASEFVRLSDGETTDRVTGKINFEQLMRACAAKGGEGGALQVPA